MNRTRWEIYAEILRVSAEGCSLTKAWAASELPYSRAVNSKSAAFKRYLKVLQEKGMVTVSKQGRSRIVQATSEGRKFLRRVDAMIKFWNHSRQN